MREIFKFEKGYWYPHMSVADKAIWERFIDQYPQAYDSCQYDFHVGSPPPFDPTWGDGVDREQDKLYRKRIDVVARHGSELDIVEVKPNAGPSTIGQVKGYRTLYIRDEEPLGKVNTVIVTDKASADMEFLCKEEGVTLIVV